VKAAYITTYDAQDIQQWSGTGLNIAEALKSNGIHIDYIGKLRDDYHLLFKGKEFLYSKLLRKTYLRRRSKTVAYGYARQISERLQSLDPDVLVSPGSIPVSYLDHHKPIVFWTDATFAGMIGFYAEFSNLCRRSIGDGNAAEQAALDRCALAIYSSDWAAETALEHYQVDRKKIKVVPFGANMNSAHTWADIKTIIDDKKSDVCRLLFIGVDWFRKGGDIVFDVVKELNRQGLRSQLTVVGCAPDITEPLPSFVKSLGFISKVSPQGVNRIAQLFEESHFLFVPSRADCTPIVFCEANSFGVPCLSSNIGGISTVIRSDVNGYVFDKGAAIDSFCTYIAGQMGNPAAYKELAYSSFHEYRRRLNWPVAGRTVKTLIEDALY
jgi:glycosyltransferase involved in cell wall biosynthesis